jgi:ABC-type multidrug transport system permease subunit
MPKRLWQIAGFNFGFRVQLVMNFLVMSGFFLPGALFPLKNVPGALVFLARMDPLSYGSHWLCGPSSHGTMPGAILPRPRNAWQ